MKTLLIDACVRENSRTLLLTEHLLKKFDSEVIHLKLENENLCPMGSEMLSKRDDLLAEGKTDDPLFKYARQFAEADCIVFAAPFWDIAFPALLKLYLEQITVAGITFEYDHGITKGLCYAKKAFYITTSGGPIVADFGFPYVKFICENFFGIPETICFKAEMLDIHGNDVNSILSLAMSNIDKYFSDITHN